MKIIKSLEEIKKPFKNAVVTIGNFDGVHIGHQALLNKVTEKSDALDGTGIAMTFEPHPIKALTGNDPPRITSYMQKAELISRAKLDVLICILFNRDFSAVSPQSFVEDILIRKIGMKNIIVGKDYTFGKNRAGNIDLLKAYADRLQFELIVIEWIHLTKHMNCKISSTLIRERIMAGEMEEANKMLGRNYQIYGTSFNIGQFGFPMLGMHLKGQLCPKPGIYVVTVDVRKKQHMGLASIEDNSISDNQIVTIEIQDSGFIGDSNQEIHVNFIKRLRNISRCSCIDFFVRSKRKTASIPIQVVSSHQSQYPK